jgi:DnaJ like chaperone protein
MAKFGKWLGGGLGWAFFGPLGGLLGFALGSVLDQAQVGNRTSPAGRTTTGDFAMSLLVLVAAVMKADGKVLKSELEYVKTFFVRNFGMATAQEAMLYLRDLLNQPIPVRDVTRQIKNQLDYSSRLQLLHLLYGVSLADGITHPLELKLIEQIAAELSISQQDALSIKSMFIEDIDSSYKILEIEEEASIEEIKKAYRTMANKHHPDKVSYLGEDFRKAANEKFQKVNEAYEKIKKERGFV